MKNNEHNYEHGFDIKNTKILCWFNIYILLRDVGGEEENGEKNETVEVRLLCRILKFL